MLQLYILFPSITRLDSFCLSWFVVVVFRDYSSLSALEWPVVIFRGPYTVPRFKLGSTACKMSILILYKLSSPRGLILSSSLHLPLPHPGASPTVFPQSYPKEARFTSRIHQWPSSDTRTKHLASFLHKRPPNWASPAPRASVLSYLSRVTPYISAEHQKCPGNHMCT